MNGEKIVSIVDRARKRDWWPIFWTVVTLVATLALFFWIADAEAQLCHCSTNHPNGPFQGWSYNEQTRRHELRLHNTDPAFPLFSGFHLMFSNEFLDIRLSDELAAMPGLVFVQKSFYGGYQFLMAFFAPDAPSNTWATGTPILTFGDTCQSRFPFCKNGPVMAVGPGWWILTSSHDNAFYPGWKQHIGQGTAEIPHWDEQPVSTKPSTWSAAKELFR